MLNRFSNRLNFFAKTQPLFNKLGKYTHRLRFFINKNNKLLISLFIAFAVSDLMLIKSYDFLIPEKELAPLSVRSQERSAQLSSDHYKMVWENNIFHTGPIPSELKTDDKNIEPVLSSLPFVLKGTIIHANPSRSVATIQVGSDSKAYQEGRVIEKQAKITKIERAKVVFFNQNNSRLEYIVIPEKEVKLNISYKKEFKKPVISKGSSLVKRVGNTFKVKRSDVKEHLTRLPEILSQARVVPHTENGEFKGWRFASINKGSVFQDLGFEKGDVIKQVDGEVVTSPEQALELFDGLKNESRVKMVVEKNGKDVELEYNVDENEPQSAL